MRCLLADLSHTHLCAMSSTTPTQQVVCQVRVVSEHFQGFGPEDYGWPTVEEEFYFLCVLGVGGLVATDSWLAATMTNPFTLFIGTTRRANTALQSPAQTWLARYPRGGAQAARPGGRPRWKRRIAACCPRSVRSARGRHGGAPRWPARARSRRPAACRWEECRWRRAASRRR